MVLEEASQKNKSCVDNAVHQCPPTTPLLVILEIGCGSGAIALSLLSKLPQVSFMLFSHCAGLYTNISQKDGPCLNELTVEDKDKSNAANRWAEAKGTASQL